MARIKRNKSVFNKISNKISHSRRAVHELLHVLVLHAHNVQEDRPDRDAHLFLKNFIITLFLILIFNYYYNVNWLALFTLFFDTIACFGRRCAPGEFTLFLSNIRYSQPKVIELQLSFSTFHSFNHFSSHQSGNSCSKQLDSS